MRRWQPRCKDIRWEIVSDRVSVLLTSLFMTHYNISITSMHITQLDSCNWAVMHKTVVCTCTLKFQARWMGKYPTVNSYGMTDFWSHSFLVMTRCWSFDKILWHVINNPWMKPFVTNYFIIMVDCLLQMKI